MLKLIVAVAMATLWASGCTPASTESPQVAPAKPATPTSAPAPASEPKVAGHGPEKKEVVKTQVHGLSNVSGIEYINAACTAGAPCKCKGSLMYGDNALAKIGVTKAQLAEGAWCVFGDFDANGFADLAVLAGDWKPEGAAAQVQILLFDELGLRATTGLPKRMKSLGVAEVGGKQVLIEPAAGTKYYFQYSQAKGFELKP